MIQAIICRNAEKRIYAFKLMNHGDPMVCAAVSFLVQNTANSIETFTSEPFDLDYDPQGGFLRLELPQIKEGQISEKADLLLESMALGLRSLMESYSKDIEVKESS